MSICEVNGKFAGILLDDCKEQSEEESKVKRSFLSNFLSEEMAKNQKAYLKGAYLAYQAAEEALKDFQAARFENFDALAGDAQCHIRATLICLYGRNSDIAEPIQKELDSIVVKKKQVVKLLKEEVKFNPSELDCSVSDRALFVVLSRILTTTKVVEKMADKWVKEKRNDLKKISQLSFCASCQEIVSCDFERSCPEKLNTLIPNAMRGKIIPRSKKQNSNADEEYRKLLDSITDVAKANLCRLSCQLLLEQAEKTNIDNFTQKMLAKGNIITDRFGRGQLPCYYVTRACFEIALKENIPVAVVMKGAAHMVWSVADQAQAILFFCPKNGQYEMAKPDEAQNDKPLIVIESQYCLAHKKGQVSDIKSVEQCIQDIGKAGLLNLIGFEAIAHPQYVGADNSDFEKIPLLKGNKEKLQELAALLNEAEKAGAYFAKNQSVFGINHIFPGTLKTRNFELQKKKISQLPLKEQPQK